MAVGKCPLGFEGEMPKGHPTVPGFVKDATAATGLFGSDDGASSTTTYLWLAFDALLILVVALALLYNDRPVGVRARPELPKVAPAYPLLGNLPYLLQLVWNPKPDEGGMLHAILEWQRTLGKGGMPFTFTAPGPSFGGRCTAINRPEYIQWAQKTNFENYQKGEPFRRNFDDVLSRHGIFAADGETWRKVRSETSRLTS